MKPTLFAAAVLACVSVAAYAQGTAPAAAPAAPAAPAAAAPAAAAETAAPNSQQQKMKDCNAQAAGKKGADRKAFMKTCLSASGSADAAAAPAAASSAKTSQQQKMKDCSAQAKTQKLKGADRKTFMSTCLKGSS